MLIGETIRGMFSRNEPVEIVPAVRLNGPLEQRGKVTLAAWNLSDIAFYAIRYTSDFQYWSPSIHDLVAICNEHLAWDGSRSKNEFSDLDNDSWLLKFAIGFTQKQLWYQEFRIAEEFNRQVELIEVIPKEIETKLDLDFACENVTGFKIRSFRILLGALLTVCSKKSDLTKITFDSSATKFHPEMTAENVKKVIEFFAADYQEFRGSKLMENHFYLKPIVRTSSNKLIAVNHYLIAKKIIEGPLWAIRDYYNYKKNGSQDFINEFGLYFEKYIEKLLEHFLSPDTFERVPQTDTGLMADWFIYTPRYRLIIEQKSSIAKLMIKSLYPDLESIKTYLDKLKEGVYQLDATEVRHKENKRITIKLLLHYETLYLSDGTLRPFVVSKAAPELNSTENIIFCNIGEFERLVGILGEQANKADEILDSKLFLEREPDKLGKELSQVMANVFKDEEKYVISAFDHLRSYFQNKLEN